MDNVNNNAESAPNLEENVTSSAEEAQQGPSSSSSPDLDNVNLAPEEEDDHPLKEEETVPLLDSTETSKSTKEENVDDKKPKTNTLQTASEDSKTNTSGSSVNKKPDTDPQQAPAEGSKISKEENSTNKKPVVFYLEKPEDQESGTGLLYSLKNAAGNILSSGSSSRPTEYDPESVDDEESTPLLSGTNFNSRIMDRVWLTLIVIIVVLGVSIGAFLLVWLGKVQSESGYFNYILRNDWITLEAEYESPNHMKNLTLPVHNVFLVELNSTDKTICHEATSYENCVELLRKNHIKHRHEPDILYNFIVDQDGNIYEGRGWEHCTCKGRFANEDLTVAVLVNNNYVSDLVPTYVLNFLNKAAIENNLNPCYRTFVYNGTALYKVANYIKSHRNLC